MRPRTKTLPIPEQADKVFRAIADLGGSTVSFRQISSFLGTEDLTMFRQGLDALIEKKQIVQNGKKRGTTYSLLSSSAQSAPSEIQNISNEVMDDLEDPMERTEQPRIIPDTVLFCASTPEDFLIELVRINQGCSNDELVGFLQARFPGNVLEHNERIKTAVKQKKISFVHGRKPGLPGARCYFYPFDEDIKNKNVLDFGFKVS